MNGLKRLTKIYYCELMINDAIKNIYAKQTIFN